MTALKSSKSPQKPGNYFSLGSARWIHSVRKVLQRAFPLQVWVQIVSHFVSIDLLFPVFWVQRGGTHCASTWGDPKPPQSPLLKSQSSSMWMQQTIEWLQTLTSVFPCIYRKVSWKDDCSANQRLIFNVEWEREALSAVVTLVQYGMTPATTVQPSQVLGDICRPQEN